MATPASRDAARHLPARRHVVSLLHTHPARRAAPSSSPARRAASYNTLRWPVARASPLAVTLRLASRAAAAAAASATVPTAAVALRDDELDGMRASGDVL